MLDSALSVKTGKVESPVKKLPQMFTNLNFSGEMEIKKTKGSN